MRDLLKPEPVPLLCLSAARAPYALYCLSPGSASPPASCCGTHFPDSALLRCRVERTIMPHAGGLTTIDVKGDLILMSSA